LGGCDVPVWRNASADNHYISLFIHNDGAAHHGAPYYDHGDPTGDDHTPRDYNGPYDDDSATLG
jgi:hypothetical protein